MQKLLPHLQKAAVLLLFTLLAPFSARACDTSGYDMLDITDNGDGTFTIQWLVMVAGGNTTGVGSTWGFWLNVGAPIVSVTPGSLTATQSGITLNGVVNGQTVSWGNPVPSPAPPFVDITIHPNDEQFTVTIVVQGAPIQWNGGGQEANMCPGGPGTGDNYEGEYPCFEPTLTTAMPMLSLCAGTPKTLVVVPNHLVQTITWTPGGQTGPTLPIIATDPTTYTATAVGQNPNCPFSLTIDVEILPQPMIESVNPEVEVCPGQAAVLQTASQDVNSITWSPQPGSGPFLVAVPTTSPQIYTATGTNTCGSVSTIFTVTIHPLPSVTVSDDVTICTGDETFLNAIVENDDFFNWLPVNSSSTELAVAPTTTTTYTAFASNQCGQASKKVKVTVLQNSTNTIQLAACPGKTVTYNGLQLAPGTTSIFTLTAANGCDSIVTVNVVAKQNSTATLNLKACQNKTVSYGGQNLAPNTSTLFTLPAANGCDSLLTVNVSSLPIYNTTLNLKACEGKSVVYAGQTLAAGTTTPVVLMTTEGCDSTVAVTVQALPNFSSDLTLQTCPGKTVGYNGLQLAANTTTPVTLVAQNGCDSVVTVTVVEKAILTSTVNAKACTGSTFPYNGQNLAPGSTQNFTFTSSLGCDSIVTVMVEEIQKFQTTINRTACAGQSILHNGQSIAAGASQTFNFTTALGCDSVVTVIVASLPTASSSLKIKTCPATPVVFAGQTLQPGTVTPVKLTAANGCDSTVTVTVEAILVQPSTVNLTACKGTTVFFGGKNLAPNTTEIFKFPNFQGCDSLVTVNVAELPTFASSVKLQACQGFSANYNGQMLPPGTNLDFIFKAQNGCDSVVNVVVEEVAGYQTTLPLKACPGDFAVYQGQNLPIGSVTPFHFTALGGCDSTVTVLVSALPTGASTLVLAACPNETVLYAGQNLLAGTTTPVVLTGANGCDSTVTVLVLTLPTPATNLTLAACPNETVSYAGQNLLAGTTTPIVLTGANGCDSTVTVKVETLPILTKTLDLKACIGGTATYNGQNLAIGTTQDFTFSSVITGCDSIVTVNVTALPPKTSTLTLPTCAGVSVNYAGQSLAPGSVTPILLSTPTGCDSTVTVSVVIGPPITSTKTIKTCIGQPVVYAGQTLQPGSVTPVLLKTVAGCDSTVTVTVEEFPLITSSVFLKACPGETAPYNGQNLQPGTVQNFKFFAQNGCDSVVTVTVAAPQTAVKSIELSACSGETALFNGQQLAAGTTKVFDFQTWQGCDSTVTVTVNELSKQVSTVNLQACTGTTITYLGQQLQPNSTQKFDLKTWQGCDSTVTVNVNEVAILTSNLTLTGCEGASIPYAGSSVKTGETKQFKFPSSLGCDSVVTVTAIGIPPAASAERIEICPGKTVNIFGIEQGKKGFYSKTFVGANGCDSTHTVELAIVNPVSLQFPTAPVVDLGHETTLFPNALPPTGLLFSWKADTTLSCLDCPNPIAMPVSNTTYFLTVTDSDGCSASAQTLVKIDRERHIYIPNAISPNGDGTNDYFLVFADVRAVKNIRKLMVYSRWGELVLERTDIQPNVEASGWDGRQRGKDLPPNVYVYYTEIEFIDGVVKIYKGDVTIVK